MQEREKEQEKEGVNDKWRQESESEARGLGGDAGATEDRMWGREVGLRVSLEHEVALSSKSALSEITTFLLEGL